MYRTLAGFELDATELAALTTAMAKCVHETVDARVRDAASPTCVVESMKTAFSRVFSKDTKARASYALNAFLSFITRSSSFGFVRSTLLHRVRLLSFN